MKAPTAEWIFVLNERDPRVTKRQIQLLGLDLLLIPAAAALSWHHLSPPWRILGKKGCCHLYLPFPDEKRETGPAHLHSCLAGLGEGSSRPTGPASPRRQEGWRGYLSDITDGRALRGGCCHCHGG